MKVVQLQSFLVLLLCCYAASQSCDDSDEISCNNQDKCIPHRYICDEDEDCYDDADEDHELCTAWRNDDCERGSARCSRFGDTMCVSVYTYCTYSNPPCEGDLDPRICIMVLNNTVVPLNTITLPVDTAQSNLNESLQLAEEFNIVMNSTISHPQCPTMFTLVGDQCLSLFFVGSVSWGEAQAFCQVIGGDLVTFRNVSHYTAVVTHLTNNQMTTDFWIGGRMTNESIGWTWTDDVPMQMGSPYWAVRYTDDCRTRNVSYPELGSTREANDGTCYNYLQAPGEYPRGSCVALSYEHYYYMIDEDCLAKKSPLCVFTDEDYFTEQIPL